MEENLYTWAVHMENKKTGEKQIQKVKSDDASHATSKRFFYGSEWVWTGTEPWHNVSDSVVRISRNFYRKMAAKYRVYQMSPFGEKQEIFCTCDLYEAESFCNHHDWKIQDENQFIWGLGYEQVYG